MRWHFDNTKGIAIDTHHVDWAKRTFVTKMHTKIVSIDTLTSQIGVEKETTTRNSQVAKPPGTTKENRSEIKAAYSTVVVVAADANQQSNAWKRSEHFPLTIFRSIITMGNVENVKDIIITIIIKIKIIRKTKIKRADQKMCARFFLSLLLCFAFSQLWRYAITAAEKASQRCARHLCVVDGLCVCVGWFLVVFCFFEFGRFPA